MISIREEKPGDIAAVRAVTELAFGQTEEACIVDALRQNCERIVSLVAVDGDEVVGHILFSPVTAESDQGAVRGMGLAPIAVAPQHQRQGIGAALINHGLALLRERCCPFVIVLGHADYYPRFGFEPASRRGLRSQWEGVPDNVFMVLVLDADAMEGVSGVARYRDEFDQAM